MKGNEFEQLNGVDRIMHLRSENWGVGDVRNAVEIAQLHSVEYLVLRVRAGVGPVVMI